MTGYGLGEAPHLNGLIVVEVRAVNHRYIDVRVRLPQGSGDISPAVESYVRQRLERGRIEVAIRAEGDAVPRLALDTKRARDAYHQLTALRDELSPSDPVPLALLASVPDLFTVNVSAPYSDELRNALAIAMERACNQVVAMRAREGDALAQDLQSRLQTLLTTVSRVKLRVPQVVASYHKRLGERIDALLQARGHTSDAGRLEQELALFADRSDITEELTRFASHCEQFVDLLKASESSQIGRRLDFLLQEMGREVNTLGAKSADTDISRAVVDLKAELERMREQVQNVV
ncbi:MAG: YicC family protein [Sandaracinaceae bacterium]|nr:YicC family protein [Sandaracinaceae bacterium]